MPHSYHFLLPNSGFIYGPFGEIDHSTWIHEQTHMRCYRTTSYGDALRWCDWTLALAGMAIAHVCPGIYEPPRTSALHSPSIRFVHDLNGLSWRDRRKAISAWVVSSVRFRRTGRASVGTSILSVLSLTFCSRAARELTAASIVREFLTDGRPDERNTCGNRTLVPKDVLKAFRFMDRCVTANRVKALKRFSKVARGSSLGWRRRFAVYDPRELPGSDDLQMLKPLKESQSVWKRMLHEFAWDNFPEIGTSGRSLNADKAFCPVVKRVDAERENLAITGALIFECLAGLTEMHWKVQLDAFTEDSKQGRASPMMVRPAQHTLNKDEVALFDFISACIGAKPYDELRENYNHASFFWDFGLHYVLLLSALMPPVPSGHRLPTVLDRLFGRVCGPSHLSPGHRLLILLDCCEASPELCNLANRETIRESLSSWHEASMLNDNDAQEMAMRSVTDSMEQTLDLSYLAFCTSLGFGRANAHPLARTYISLEQMAYGDDGFGFCYGMFRDDRDSDLRRFSWKYEALPSIRPLAGARPLLTTLGYLTSHDFPNGVLDRARWAVVPPDFSGNDGTVGAEGAPAKEAKEAKEQIDRMFLGVECFLVKYGFRDTHCASGRLFPDDIEIELAELADRRKVALRAV